MEDWCVVYFDHNSTHLMNVSKALLVQGVAEICEHSNNEFNPYMWNLYVEKATTPTPHREIVSVVLLLAVALLMMHLCSKKLRRWAAK